jgi:phage head maturation protease
MPDRPTPGRVEERSAPVEVDQRRIRGVIPFGQRSVDLGGYREIIEPRALDGANVDNLVCTVEHAGVPIGRHPGTLALEQRSDGLHWAVEPPASRQDIVEAVQRGDLRSGSWRMVVARDRWDGDTRHIEAISELRDVSLVAAPAYPSAAVELRSQPHPADGQENSMPESTAPAVEPDTTTETAPVTAEDRSTPQPTMRVEDRSASDAPTGTLAERFRRRGFPGETATLPFNEVFEDRAVSFAGSLNLLNQVQRPGTPLGADRRYAWPVFSRIGVDQGVTSVAVPQQTSRALATPASMVRAIDATTNKPETGSTVTMTQLALQQVATVSSGIPNVYLQSDSINSIVETDLTLALNAAFDELVLAGLTGAAFLAPGSDPLLISIRKAVSILQAAGYSPDTLILDPASAVTIDTLQTTTDSYVFQAGNFAPGQLFGLSRRIATNIPAPAVVDSSAFGRLYASPVSLAKFEQNSGVTNTSVLRLECNAVFGVERIPAAVRIAAE